LGLRECGSKEKMARFELVILSSYRSSDAEMDDEKPLSKSLSDPESGLHFQGDNPENARSVGARGRPTSRASKGDGAPLFQVPAVPLTRHIGDTGGAAGLAMLD
jgi:hypothetical protein